MGSVSVSSGDGQRAGAFLCSFRGRAVNISGRVFSRGSDRTDAALGERCDEWAFEAGDALTLIAFFESATIEAVMATGNLVPLERALNDLTLCAYAHFPGQHGVAEPAGAA